MNRLALSIMATTLIAVLGPGAIAEARKRPQHGVFGTINGKRFKATNREGVGDPCVKGIYDPNGGSIVFAAIECGVHRRRQGNVRKNYKTLIMACTKFDPNVNTSVFPYEFPCPGSGYAETRTGRFRRPISMTQWGANFVQTDTLLVTSNVKMRVDAFDGTNVRGVVFGVFDVPVSGAASAVPAPISGELQFDFPFAVR